MQLEKPALVIFDMDGTTVRHVNPAMLSTLEFLDNTIQWFANIFNRSGEVKDFSHDPVAPRGLLVHRALHKLRRKPVEQIVQPCPGIYDLLKFLKAQNIPMALVSNGLGKGYGHDILKVFKLDTYFDVEIFREDIQKSKPHPDGLMRALRGVKPDFNEKDFVWHIGDRSKDVVATIAADEMTDCKVIPFAYGIHSALAVLKNNIGKDQIIISYPDFLNKIKKILS